MFAYNQYVRLTTAPRHAVYSPPNSLGVPRDSLTVAKTTTAHNLPDTTFTPAGLVLLGLNVDLLWGIIGTDMGFSIYACQMSHTSTGGVIKNPSEVARSKTHRRNLQPFTAQQMSTQQRGGPS